MTRIRNISGFIRVSLRTVKPIFFAAALFFIFATAGLRAGTVSLLPDEIAQLRSLIATNPEAKAQFLVLQRTAQRALNGTPDPVEKIITEGRLAGNPDKVRTDKSLADMTRIQSLAWTWAATDDARFAAKAREFILAWAKLNQPDGDAINETQLEPLITSYDLLRGTFSDADRQTVDDWLRNHAQVSWKDHRGLKENWYSHRLKTVGLIGWTIGDATLVAEVVNGFQRQINSNIKPDGATTDFYLRDAFHYHLYDVEPLLTLARVAERNGKDFYGFKATNGATLGSGVAFVVPYADGEKTHVEFVNSKVQFDRKRAANGQGDYQPHVWNPHSSVTMFSLAAWFEPRYQVLAAKLAGHPDENYFNWQMVLNAVSRHGPFK
ncbi:MAG TPA: alginate lyase family protein [Candidatus Sulfotelmatobacter sp.]|nr:alginate lyase family protein [Candidatus Sulfotelmatobacter sp.]